METTITVNDMSLPSKKFVRMTLNEVEIHVNQTVKRSKIYALSQDKKLEETVNLIKTAVNSHQDLIEALKIAVESLYSFEESSAWEESDSDALRKIESALAKATQQ